MKRFFVILASFLFVLALAFPVLAQDKSKENFRQGELVTLPAGETVNRDFFAFGERVEISGTVNGDVYAGGGIVIVDGKVNGDLLAAGGTLTISGSVSQDARLGGGQITITGKIGRNLTIGGGNVELTDSARVNGSLVAGAGNLNLAAPVQGSARIGAGNLTISNRINGDVDAGIGTLRLTSKARVNGNLTYWSDKDASIDPAAKVGGEVTRNTPAEGFRPAPSKIWGIPTGAGLFFKIISIISTLIIGLLIILLFPRFSQKAADNITRRPWPSVGFGLLALVATPIITIILLVTIVGIPLALILFLLYLMSLYIVRIFAMLWAGRLLSEKTGWKASSYWSFIVGAVIYYLIQMVPVVGVVVTALVILFGLGAALIAKKEAYTLARKESIL